MRRSICYCEPHLARAGEVRTWKFIYTTAVPLNKGAKLKFDLSSKGHDIDWQIPDHNAKAKKNLIYAYIDPDTPIYSKPVEVPNEFAPQFEFTLPAPIKAGANFTVVIGEPPNQKEPQKESGNMAQTMTQRRRHFLLYIDAKGNGNYSDPEVFTLDIKGNKLDRIRIIVPSFTAKNKRFDIVIRFEDVYGNLTSFAPEETLVELSYNQLRDNLNWKLFVPETGFVTLPNFYFNDVGFYTIQLKNLHTGDIYYSSPIQCFAVDPGHLLWGLLHGESDRFDSNDNIENCVRHMRDEVALGFFASSPFESQQETPNEVWKVVSQNIQEFNEPDRFITYLGCQWQGESSKEGVRILIHAKDGKSIPRKKEAKYASLKKIYKSYSSNEFLSIPSFTMGKGYEYDFSDYNMEYEPVVEIYNSWGSSECTEKEGNPFPISCPKKSGVKESPAGSILAALKNNCRFGFVAGGLDDRGIYTDFFDDNQEQYPPGLTAVISKEQTRESIFEALKARSCYATTGERIILGYSIIGSAMGSQLTTQEKPGLMVNRHIAGSVSGTDLIDSIEIIRNGEVIHEITPNNEPALEFTYDDMVNLKKVALKSPDSRPPFAFYYVRVTQKNGHVAWGSPIWIDLVEVAKQPQKGKSDKISTKKSASTDDELD